MVCSSCDFERAADRQFTSAKATKELRAYRSGRVEPTTRVLRDAVVDAGLNDGWLLDIGGGVGALAFELLEHGMARAFVLDASQAYAAAASDEAARRGRHVRVVHGEFLRVSEKLPRFDLVALDRVVCCYPQYQALLEQALKHAHRGVALSYPRDRWYVRLGMWLANKKRASTSGFRTFVHSPSRIQETIERAGFVLIRRRFTVAWTMDVYLRDGRPTDSGVSRSFVS